MHLHVLDCSLKAFAEKGIDEDKAKDKHHTINSTGLQGLQLSYAFMQQMPDVVLLGLILLRQIMPKICLAS